MGLEGERIPSMGQRPPERVAEQLYRRIEESGALPTGAQAQEAAAAVFCALLRRASGGEARDFAAVLPRSLHDSVAPCALHRGEAPEKLGRAEFLGRLAEHFQVPEGDAERLARVVFENIRDQLPPQEVDDLAKQLPSDLVDLLRST